MIPRAVRIAAAALVGLTACAGAGRAIPELDVPLSAQTRLLVFAPHPDDPQPRLIKQAAQAAGDAQVLAGHGRSVLRLHLTNRAAGVAQLQEIIAALAARSASVTES